MKFFAVLLLLFTGYLYAQGLPQPEVRLEPHDGKTNFEIGEPILLDLIIDNPTGQPMTLNVTDYGDNSDPVDISPKAGWFVWQGLSHHDNVATRPLTAKPIHLPIRVDRAVIFRTPGHYEVRVTEDRVMAGTDLYHLTPLHAITSNPVGIDLTAMSDRHETAIVQNVETVLANASNDPQAASQRRTAVARLAALQGDIALAEKIKLLIAAQEDFRRVATEAWASTRNLQRQLEMIEAAWRDPQLDPAYDMPAAMDETRRLLARQPLIGWQLDYPPPEPDAVEVRVQSMHRQDMLALLNSMPERTGSSRLDAAYYLAEFGGLPQTAQLRARSYAVEEFPYMDDVQQHMLLETVRPPLHDVQLLPALRALLQKNPGDTDALAAYLQIAPDEATPYAVRAICAPEQPPLIDAFAAVKESRLPQVDECLRPLLEPRAATNEEVEHSGRANFIWKLRVVLAARFGSPALLPLIERSAVQRLATEPNDPEISAALLAAEIRDDPNAAVAHLRPDTLSPIAWYDTDKVFESAHEPFPSVVELWLRKIVREGNDDIAADAAYQLSLGGRSGDSAVIEQRLITFRAIPRSAAPGKATTMAEANMVTALLQSKAWMLTAEQRASITAGCVTDPCRRYGATQHTQ